jgi:hypothetical protein
MPEQFGFKQSFRQAGAVDRNKRLACAAARGAHLPRNDFFTGPALAGNQDLGVAGRNAANLLPEF